MQTELNLEQLIIEQRQNAKVRRMTVRALTLFTSHVICFILAVEFTNHAYNLLTVSAVAHFAMLLWLSSRDADREWAEHIARSNAAS